MSVGYLTTNELIESAKRRAMIPEHEKTLQTESYLAFANEEMQIGIVPSILKYHEEYFVRTQEVVLEANKSSYAIPYRAIGGRLRGLFYKDPQGDLREMTRISPENKVYFQGVSSSNDFMTYYLQGDNIIITPDVGSSANGSLLFEYFLRPNELVEEDRIAIIQSISVGATTTEFTVDGVPTGFSTSTLLDILQHKPGHKTLEFDLTPVDVNSSAKTITFNNSDLPTGIEQLDHIAFAGECMIPQIPSDLHSILAQRIAARCVEALGDQAGLQSANLKLSEMESKTADLVDNRVDSAPIKINNRRSILNQTRSRYRRW